MSTATADPDKKPTFTQSQKESAYFNMDDGYDPLVYENTFADYWKIAGMLFLFYIFQGLHWQANFFLGVGATEISTIYNLIIFGTAVLVILGMLIFGSTVNAKKVSHEFYQEKISEEKLRLAEEQARASQKAANEAKLREQGIMKS